MKITIGGIAYDTRKPDDLDAQVISATGCSSAELLASFTSGTTPTALAAVLLPHLAGDVMALPDLARAIADEPDLAGVICAIRRVAAAHEDKPVAAPRGKKGTT